MTLVPNAYQIELTDPTGIQLLPNIDQYVSLNTMRAVNNVGTCTLVLSDQTPDQKAFMNTLAAWERFFIDGRIRVMVSTNGGPMTCADETVYFIRKTSRDLDASNHMTMTFECEDTIGLLKRNTITNDATNAQAKYASTYLDNMCKAVFTSMFGAGANCDWSSLITVAANQSLGYQSAMQFPGQQALQVMQKIAQVSTTNGIYLAFDVYSDGQAFEYRTYVGQRGIDRRASTGNALIIGPEFGNVLSCHYEDDHTAEGTYIIAGAQTSEDTVREGLSPFGKIVQLITTSGKDSNSQLADAQAGLRAARSKRLFTAQMIQCEGSLYSVQYNYGDFVTAQFWGQAFDCHMDAVSRTIAAGKETITCLLRSI
jgi:hypothetical protein